MRAADTPAAIAEAKALYATEGQDAEFAMLFVSQGDLVWVSEGTRAGAPNGEQRAADVISTVRIKR